MYSSSQLGMKCFASQQDYVDWKSVTSDVLMLSFLECVFFSLKPIERFNF